MFLTTGLFLLDVFRFWQQVVKGFVVLVAVAIDKMNVRSEQQCGTFWYGIAPTGEPENDPDFGPRPQ